MKAWQLSLWSCIMRHITEMFVLIDFSLTVKAATLYSYLGVVRLFHLLNKGIQVLCLGRANVRAFHENPNRIHTELTFVNP